MRVLILSTSVGGGHLRAAEAIELAIRELDPATEIENVDVLTLTNAAFRKVYAQTYLDLISKAPHLLGYIYDMMDRPSSARHRSDRLRIKIQKLNLKPFIRLLESKPWDLVVNTHFLSTEIIASLRNKGELDLPHFTVTTDFETHRLWAHDPCEHYFTATEEGAVNLQHWGVPAENVTVTGIPIHPVFSRPKDRAECLKRQGLVGDRPIILQLSGGFGVGPIEKLYESVMQIDVPCEIVVVSGRNEELKQRLETMKPPSRHRTKVLGFTDQIDELMLLADVVVSKPGGLTTSETLARGAAMAIVNPVPGQESRNSDFLLENGAAIKINSVATLPYKLNHLLADGDRLDRLKAAAQRLARPQAAFEIARRVLAFQGRGDAATS
ncbi:MAG: UDP-N-acetylglucosamine--LPS N-acetylglucosamine transferase [Phycisphaerae bacterium]|nr:UDP-N-acetylglucosamine--LPS N-acetylglucosamine transferase [Phycisphaerae bacterium]